MEAFERWSGGVKLACMLGNTQGDNLLGKVEDEKEAFA